MVSISIGRGEKKEERKKEEGKSVPSMINHSGFFTRSESGWGSRRDSHFVDSASWISSWVRCRMKTGLPRHLMITCVVRIILSALDSFYSGGILKDNGGDRRRRL